MRARRTPKVTRTDSPTAAQEQKRRAATVTPAPKSETARARCFVLAAIELACVARGEVQWTNGYRAGRGDLARDEDTRLHQKEMAQWAACDRAWARVGADLGAYARAIRKEAKQTR